ncbi:hypothetical protein RHGRI_034209 [Rhododendron griersonianum]|uniref:Uncharacterized protein n=1 Tax=Rhododendron griersonianum TaxID=479676 RepID=A0AAV6I2Y1_9ERIC|nr:hypothetical protein RHGRI_034209 [Rhododendron griersonianum]
MSRRFWFYRLSVCIGPSLFLRLCIRPRLLLRLSIGPGLSLHRLYSMLLHLLLCLRPVLLLPSLSDNLLLPLSSSFPSNFYNF